MKQLHSLYVTLVVAQYSDSRFDAWLISFLSDYAIHISPKTMRLHSFISHNRQVNCDLVYLKLLDSLYLQYIALFFMTTQSTLQFCHSHTHIHTLHLLAAPFVLFLRGKSGFSILLANHFSLAYFLHIITLFVCVHFSHEHVLMLREENKV